MKHILALVTAPIIALSVPAVAEADDGKYVLDPDTQITLPEGFDAELLYSVPPEQGSWVAMAFDPKGRIVVSDQDDKGVFRVSLAKDGDPGSKLSVESLTGFPYVPIKWGKRTVGGALGFLYAFDSLYMSSMKGFYRIRDTDGDDTYDEFTLIKPLEMSMNTPPTPSSRPRTARRCIWSLATIPVCPRA